MFFQFVNIFPRRYWHYRISQFPVLQRQSAGFSAVLTRALSKSHQTRNSRKGQIRKLRDRDSQVAQARRGYGEISPCSKGLYVGFQRRRCAPFCSGGCSGIPDRAAARCHITPAYGKSARRDALQRRQPPRARLRIHRPAASTRLLVVLLLWSRSRNPSGPSVIVPRQQAGHMTAVAPLSKSSSKTLHSRGRPHMRVGPLIIVEVDGPAASCAKVWLSTSNLKDRPHEA